jgi:hypothetical protein
MKGTEMTKSKICRVCNLRSIGAGTGEINDRADARRLEMCVPCAEEANWEIVHSDHSHAGLADGSLTWKGTTFKTKKSFDAWAASERGEMERCWICHPEFNRASEEYASRTGTSREGMTVHARGSVADKIAVIKEAGEKAGGKVSVRHERAEDKKIVLSTTLTWTSRVGAKLTVVWDDRGRFLYGPSVAVGRISADTPAKAKPRKIRNVSEALRFIASPA